MELNILDESHIPSILSGFLKHRRGPPKWVKYDDLAQERPGPAARGGEVPRQVLVVVVVMPMLMLIVTTCDPIAVVRCTTRGRACRCPDLGVGPLGEWGLQLCVCWCVGLETSLGVLCLRVH